MELENQKSEKKKLLITCTSSDCENNLHCFRKSRQMANIDKGKCRTCGKDLIDWNRVYKKDINDVEFVFSSLKMELIRHYFWHIPIDIRAENYARRKGLIGLRQAVKNRLANSLKPGFYRDGRQTPYEGNIIFFAQHALACCCRKCLEYWHDIPKDQKLTEEELNYLTELIMLYVNERMPLLTEYGEKIPPIRSKNL
jgi:hypothetical protein